jgi:hypothetical protein
MIGMIEEPDAGKKSFPMIKMGASKVVLLTEEQSQQTPWNAIQID